MSATLFALLAGALAGFALHFLPGIAVDIALASALAVAAVVDLKERRIPNTLVVAGLTMVFVSTGAGGIAGSAAGFVVAGAVGLAIRILARGAFGMGDVKLIAVAGAGLGLSALPLLFLAMTLAGGLLALAGIATGRYRIQSAMPYGPAIAAGYLVALLI